MKKIKTLLLAFIISLVVGVILVILGYQFSLWVRPNITADGHVTMVLPQLFSGILIGIVGFVIAFITAYRKLKKKDL